MTTENIGELARTLTRPIATLALVGTACAGFLFGKIAADTFVPLVTMAGAFWFAARGNYGGAEMDPEGRDDA